MQAESPRSDPAGSFYKACHCACLSISPPEILAVATLTKERRKIISSVKTWRDRVDPASSDEPDSIRLSHIFFRTPDGPIFDLGRVNGRIWREDPDDGFVFSTLVGISCSSRYKAILVPYLGFQSRWGEAQFLQHRRVLLLPPFSGQSPTLPSPIARHFPLE